MVAVRTPHDVKFHRGEDGILRYSVIPGHPSGWGWFPWLTADDKPCQWQERVREIRPDEHSSVSRAMAARG